MKTTIMIVTALALTALAGCWSSKGGGMSSDMGFRLSTPFLTTDIKQGDRKTVTVTVKRDEYFKQDVKLEATASEGIKVDPTDVVVKASDSPDVQLQIIVPEKAALGEYRITLTGTPETGQATTTEIKVKVVAP